MNFICLVKGHKPVHKYLYDDTLESYCTTCKGDIVKYKGEWVLYEEARMRAHKSI
jgi:hypothetical protein